MKGLVKALKLQSRSCRILFLDVYFLEKILLISLAFVHEYGWKKPFGALMWFVLHIYFRLHPQNTPLLRLVIKKKTFSFYPKIWTQS